MPIRAVLYREDDGWVAHALEFDLIGHGESKKEALTLLSEAIEIHVENTLKEGNVEGLFTPADAKFLSMFAQGKNAVTNEVQIVLHDSERFEFGEPDVREYDGELACV